MQRRGLAAHVHVQAALVRARDARRLQRGAAHRRRPRHVRGDRAAARHVVDVHAGDAGHRRRRRSRPATCAASRSSARRPSRGSRSGTRRLPVVTSDHDQFRALLDRSTRDLAGLRIFDPEYPRPRGRRRGRAVVHDAVRSRLAAHVVDDDARRPRPRARHAADAGAVPGHARSTRAPRRSRAASCTRCASARPRRSRSAAAASTTAPSTRRRCS